MKEEARNVKGEYSLDNMRGESPNKSIAIYEKSSSASSMLFLIRKRRVVFHLSSLLS
jgi:hypothetical protein